MKKQCLQNAKNLIITSTQRKAQHNDLIIIESEKKHKRNLNHIFQCNLNACALSTDVSRMKNYVYKRQSIPSVI